MEYFCINLNIHYTLPDELWNKVVQIYPQMPGWIGFIDGIPRWYNNMDDDDNNNKKGIEVSVEPSGLQFFALMSKQEWESWIALFKKKATEALGYEVGEPEDGYDFVYFDEN